MVGSHEAARLGPEKAGRNVPGTTAAARLKQSLTSLQLQGHQEGRGRMI